MSHISNPRHRPSTLAALAISLHGALVASAQDFTTQVGEAIPSALYGPFSFPDSAELTRALGMADGIKGGFSYQLGVD